MKKHLKFSAICLSALLAISVAGCAGTTSGQTSPAPESQAQPSASSPAQSSSDEPITIRVASVYVEGHSMNKVFMDVLNQFRADHPNVTITEEFMPSEQLTVKLKTDTASNSLPDIFPVWANISNLQDVKAGMWMDLTDELDADPDWKAGFGSGTLEQFQYADAPGYWAAPLCTYGIGFYYNTEVFEKAGAEVPKTWDELLTVIEKLKAAGVTPWALGAKDTWRTEHLYTSIYYKLFGIEKASKLMDGSLTYDDPSFKDTFQKMTDLVDAGAFDPNCIGLDYSQEVAAFAAGNVGMQLNGAWGIGETDGPDTPAAIKGKIGYFAFPDFPGSEQYSKNWFGGVNDAITVKAGLEGAKKDLVIELLKKLTSKETAKRIGEETGNLPAITVELDTTKIGTLMTEVTGAIAKADKFGGDLTGFERDSAIAEKVYNYTQAIIGKMVTPEQACQDLANEVKKAG